MTEKDPDVVLGNIEEKFEQLPEDSSVFELLEMIAEATGESFETIHQRFTDIKSKK